MDSDSTLLSKILSEIEAGQTLENVVDNLDEKAKSKFIELVHLEQALAKLQPAEEDLSPESLELMRRLRSSLGSQPATTKEDAFSPGNSFGAYQIVRELGRGGMGTVYEAVQIHLGKRVAVKVIAPHILSDPQAVARFRREMKAAGQVEHGNVVRAMDAGEIQGTLYLVTEFVSGIDLAKYVAKKGPFAPQQALQIILQASCALQAAHARGITHRDVKPSNLVLTSEGNVKLLDLGLARLASERQSEFTASGAIFGTPDYMAPEQWNDPKTVDGRADLYAIGCTLFFLLTAKPPYAGNQYPTTYSKMKAHMEAPIPQLPSGDIGDFSQVNALLQRLLAKQPEQRFANATELINEIGQLIESDFSQLERGDQLEETLAILDRNAKSNSTSPTVETNVQMEYGLPFSRSQHNKSTVRNGVLLVALVLTGIVSLFVFTQGYNSTRPNIDASNLNQANSPPEDRSTDARSPSAKSPPTATAPFDSATAEKRQREWAEYLQMPVEIENSLGMRFRLIPPGEFAMGFNRLYAEDLARRLPYLTEKTLASAPENRVRITRPFYMQVHEVTQQNFQSITGRNPSWYAESGEKRDLVANLDTRTFPVDSVSYLEAVNFCKELSKLEGLGSSYSGNKTQQDSINGYRLPTESEWEMCCRAGTRTQWYSGDEESKMSSVAWTKFNSKDHSQPVGSLTANAYALFDMSGNISEWCQDWYSPDEYSSRKGGPTNDPLGPTDGVSRVIRGGSFNLSPSASQSAMRNFNSPDKVSDNYGFRLALSVDDARALLKTSKAQIAGQRQYQLNREAAEWIVSVGGRFQLLSNGRWVSKLEDIPTSDFSMQEVYLVNCQKVDPAGYAKLSKLDLLRGLSCWDSTTDDACLVALLSSRSIQDSIEVIQAHRCPISDAVASKLAECKKLNSLTLPSTKITDYQFIQQLQDLKAIDVSDCRISSSSHSAIAQKSTQWKSLGIDLPDFAFISQTSSPIDFPKLEQLNLYERVGSPRNFKLSEICSNLRVFALDSIPYQRFDLDWNDLAQLNNIETLQLSNFEPTALPKNQQIPQLEYLQLNSFQLDLSAIESFLRCSSKLKNLTMSHCSFAEEFARHQQSIPELSVEVEMISIGTNSVVAEAMARLLPNSKVTLNGRVIDSPLTESNLYQPQTTSQLHRAVARRILECGGSVIIIHKAMVRPIQSVDALPTESFVLSSFILQGAPNWTMKDHQLLERIQYLESVIYLPDLTRTLNTATMRFRLSSSNFSVDSKLVHSLNSADPGLGQLGVMSIRNEDRPPESVLALPSLHGFTGVVTDEHLAKLSPDSPLSFLDLHVPNLSIDGIRGLSKLKHLAQVWYRGELTNDMIREFAELPQLRLLVMLGSKGDIQSLASELSSTKPKLTLVHPQLQVSVEEVQAINELRQAGVNLGFGNITAVKDPTQSYFVAHLAYDASQEKLVAEMLPNLRHVINLTGTVNLPETRGAIFSRDEIMSLQIQATEISDEELRQISLMESLETLYLGQSKITASGLQPVVQNCPLATLQVRHTNGPMLGTIAKAPHLKTLRIALSTVDYPAVGQLEALAGLRVLKLELAGGLDLPLQQSLARLKQVRALHLTGVTGDADEWLQLLHAELPDCLIMTEDAIVFPTLRTALPE